MVVFDKGAVRMVEFIEALQQIVLSFCNYDTDRSGTTNFVLGCV